MRAGRVTDMRAGEPDRDFFEIADEYQVCSVSNGRVQTIGAGRLVAVYSREGGDGGFLPDGVEIEQQLSAGRWRSYYPLGPGVFLKRAEKEPEPVADLEREALERRGAAILADVPVDAIPAARSFILGHVAMRDHVHGETVDDAYAHAHVMLDAEHEDHENPTHWHDEAHGLSPIYGPRP